jgi:hypothetical protein
MEAKTMNEAPTFRTPARPGHSVFVPMLLGALALACWFAFQTVQLVGERQQLTALRGVQDVQVDAATKLRASLDAMASATAKLADAGNVNAKLLVEELRKRGITINPNAAPAAPAAAK